MSCRNMTDDIIGAEDFEKVQLVLLCLWFLQFLTLHPPRTRAPTLKSESKARCEKTEEEKKEERKVKRKIKNKTKRKQNRKKNK